MWLCCNLAVIAVILLYLPASIGQDSTTLMPDDEYFTKLLLAVYPNNQLLKNCTPFECCVDILQKGSESVCLKKIPGSKISKLKGSLDTKLQLSEVNISNFNFSKCGIFPACSINRSLENKWEISCNKHLVYLKVSLDLILCIFVISSDIFILIVNFQSKAPAKPHSYFKLSLTLSDLVNGVFVLPSIAYNSLNKIDVGPVAYNSRDLASLISAVEIDTVPAGIFGFLGTLSAITSVYSLFLLSMDSFLSVRWPLKYRIGDIMTGKRALVVVLITWALSLLISCLPFMMQEMTYEMSRLTFQYILIIKPLPKSGDGSAAINRYVHALVYAVIVWGVPFVATWVLSVWTACQSQKMLKNMQKSVKTSSKSNHARNKVKHDLVRTVAVILTLFTTTVVPVFGVMMAVINLAPSTCKNEAIVMVVFFSTYTFFYGRFLNVMVYNFMNVEFREGSKKFLSSFKYWITCRNKAEKGFSNHRSLSSRISSSLSSGSRKSRSSSKGANPVLKSVEIPKPSFSYEKTRTKRSISVPPINQIKYDNVHKKLSARRVNSVTFNINLSPNKE